MGQGRLGESGRRGDVAGADRAIGRQLPHDRQPRRVRQRAEEQDVGIVGSGHGGHVIDVFLY
jgi:hypothetical protein